MVLALFFFKDGFYFYLCVHKCCICITCMQVLQSPEEGIRFPGTEVAGACKPAHPGTLEQYVLLTAALSPVLTQLWNCLLVSTEAIFHCDNF